MNRVKTAFIIAIVAASLIACDKKQTLPDGFTQESYDLGCKALNIMEQYNNGEMDADVCYISLKEIYDKADEIHEDSSQTKEVQLNALAIAANCFDFNNRLLTGEEDT